MIFHLLPLIVISLFLGGLDMIFWERVDRVWLYISIFMLFFLTSFHIMTGILLYAGLGSIVLMWIVATIEGLARGDKIFLATTFLVYPFYLIWIILIIALFLSNKFFKATAHRVHDVPWIPFLFISTIIVYFVAYFIVHFIFII